MTRFLKRNRSNLVFYGVVILLVFALMTMHGLMPNMIGGDGGSLAARYTTYGAIECANQTGVFDLKCSLVGKPTGILSPTNMPFVTAVSSVMRVTSLSIDWAYSLVAGGVVLVSLLGTYSLLRLLKISRYVALLLAALYVYLPLLLSLQGFGGTYWGLLLLPATLYYAWKMFIELEKATWKKAIVISLVWSVLATGLLFLDGYAFFMYAAAAGILLLSWLWKKPVNKTFSFTLIAFAASLLIAYLAYKIAFPSSDTWGGSQLGIFRAMSLDVVTLFTPNARLWWTELFHLRPNLNLWGDGSNSSANYIGVALLSSAILGFGLIRRRISRLEISLFVVGLMAFTLSLGPSLKIDAKRPPLTYPITSSSYQMPSNDAIVDLPTSIAYERLPGLNSMRATYRWHALTMLVVIAFAGLGIQEMLKRNKKLFGYGLLAIICIELLPSPSTTIKAAVKTKNQMNSFNSEVITSLQTKLHKGENVVFYPNAVGGNDYLANYIIPKLGVQSYNVGNDKAVANAEKYWPPEIKQLLRTDELGSYGSARTIEKILEQDIASVVVVPYFDLRWDSYAWPPVKPDAIQRADKAIRAVSSSNKLTIEDYEHFSIIRESE